MLVFSRRRDEAIVIGDGIEVRVVRIGNDVVRIGVSAPPSVPVHRREVYDQIRSANQSAAGSADQVDRLLTRVRAASSKT
jgi:carbon storage regulator